MEQNGTSGGAPEGKKHRIAVLVVALLVSFSFTFSGSALNLAIPSIALEFGSSATVVGWIVTGFMMCTVTFAVPFGRLADLRDRRTILIIGIGAFTLFSGLTVFARSIGAVIVLRVLQGIGGAMTQGTGTAILLETYPPADRGKVLGYSVSMTYLGLTLGPVGGGILTHWFGWRAVFVAAAAMGLCGFVVAVANLPKNQNQRTEGWNRAVFDIPGMLLFMAMIFSIMYGFSLVGQRPILGGPILALGILLFILFVRHELKAAHPVIEIRLFLHNPNYLLSNLAALFNYAATFATGYLLSIYLQLIMKYDAQTAGLILICQPAVMAVLSPYFGKLSDRVSPFRLASAGMGLCAVALLSYIFVGAQSPLYHIIINLVLVGCGFGLFSSPNTNAVMSCVPPADYSVASSILATMRSMGHVSSMAIITLIMGIHLGSATFAEATSQQLVDTMHTAFIVFALICAAGVLLSLQRKKRGGE